MQSLQRMGAIAVAVVAMVAMTYVPPWREYQVRLRDPLPYVTEYRWLPTYAWHDQPPPSLRQGHGYTVHSALLLGQMFLVGLAGAAVSFQRRGVIVYVVSLVGAVVGILATYSIMPAHQPHGGWTSPLWLVFMGITGLIGFGVGLIVSLGIVSTLAPAIPSRKR